jgi:hypothetical protein
VPTRTPWEIDWGDGTPNTPVPVGTAAGTAFTHAWADGLPAAGHTVRIVAGAATRASAAGNPLATTAVDTLAAHYVFVWDGTATGWRPIDVKVWDGHAWKAADLQVYDGAKWVD